MRRTIVNLSKEISVSRPRIYRAMKRLGIELKAGEELSYDEWQGLLKELSVTKENNAQKKEDAEKIIKAGQAGLKNAKRKSAKFTKINDIDFSTIKERLANAKQEYDYNRELIVIFQEEIKTYAAENGRTTFKTHNGSESPIPAITNLDKYSRLNLALSKSISELEADLDLGGEAGDDPFA